jgi:hypothetical protein
MVPRLINVDVSNSYSQVLSVMELSNTQTQIQENPAYKMMVYMITLCTLYALTCSV